MGGSEWVEMGVQQSAAVGHHSRRALLKRIMTLNTHRHMDRVEGIRPRCFDDDDDDDEVQIH